MHFNWELKSGTKIRSFGENSKLSHHFLLLILNRNVFEPNRNLRSKTLNVGSKTLNGHSTTMNGDFNRAKKEVFPKKATTFLRNTSFYTQMRCLSIPLYKAPESSSDPQPSEHFYPNEPYHHLPYAR